MTKASFWRKDWFLGLGVSLVLLVASGTQLQLIEGLERFAYDWGVRASARTPSDRISVIAIDKRSIDNIGRWPWSREIHAKMIESLANAKAKVIGYTVFFSEPQLDPGLAYVNRLLEAYQRLVPANTDPSAPPRAVSPELLQIGATLQEAESALNTDRKLAESFAKAGNVVLPLLFTFGEPRGKPDKPLPEFVRKNALSIQGGSGDLPLFTSAVEVPIVESLGAAAAAVGHLNSVPDVDGAIRTEALAITYYDEYYPSLAVMMVARSLNLTAKDIKIRPGEALQIGNFRVSADPTLQMFTYFYKDRDGRPVIQEDSFYDVASGKIPLEKYRDKIVLIGPTAAGVGSIFVTPVNPAMPAVELQAHTVSSLLQGHFFVAPTWGWIVERGVYLLVALYLTTLLPRLSAGLGAVVQTAGIGEAPRTQLSTGSQRIHLVLGGCGAGWSLPCRGSHKLPRQPRTLLAAKTQVAIPPALLRPTTSRTFQQRSLCQQIWLLDSQTARSSSTSIFKIILPSLSSCRANASNSC